MQNTELIINKLQLLGYIIDNSQNSNDWAIAYRDSYGNKGFAIFENYLYISKPIYISIIVYSHFIAAAKRQHIGEYSIYNRYRNMDLASNWSHTHYRVVDTDNGQMMVLRNTRTGYIYAVGPTGAKKLIYKSRVAYSTRIEVAESDLGGILVGISEQQNRIRGDNGVQFKETVYNIGEDLKVRQLG